MPRITQYLAMGVGTAGAMTDISTYVDLEDGVTYSWGRRTEFEDTAPGEFSFTLDNQDGRFTPDNTTSPYVTTVTEGMDVCWQAGLRLVAGTIRAIEPTFPSGEAAWSQVRITCDDMLGNMARRTFSAMADGINEAAQQQLMWRFDDLVGTVAAVEANGNTSMSKVGAGVTVYGQTAISGIPATRLLVTS